MPDTSPPTYAPIRAQLATTLGLEHDLARLRVVCVAVAAVALEKPHAWLTTIAPYLAERDALSVLAAIQRDCQDAIRQVQQVTTTLRTRLHATGAQAQVIEQVVLAQLAYEFLDDAQAAQRLIRAMFPSTEEKADG
jgi:hypothetical protein